MDVCKSVPEIRDVVSTYRMLDERIGLVTTMGALHEGHLTLMRRAREDNDRVVATIFVNPTQFGEKADLADYPSDDARDISLLRAEGVDALFLPEVEVIYPPGDETIVETTHLANVLHGKVRPGHFRGVATVVARLFNICLPDRAYFGEKDYQQLQVIKRMVRDLHFPIEIIGVPTVREPDGLAMSSRNVRLSPEHRKEATVLNRCLNRAENLAARGGKLDDLIADVHEMITQQTSGELVAFDVVDPASFEPLSGRLDRPFAIMMSVRFGTGDKSVLLIDQREINP